MNSRDHSPYAPEQGGYHSGNSCSTGSQNDLCGCDTVSNASTDAVRERNSSEDWPRLRDEGLLSAQHHDSGTPERTCDFFHMMLNDGGDPLLVAALPLSTAMNVNLNGIMDSPLPVAMAAGSVAVETFQSHQVEHEQRHASQYPQDQLREGVCDSWSWCSRWVLHDTSQITATPA